MIEVLLAVSWQGRPHYYDGPRVLMAGPTFSETAL